ncbi:MAG: Glu/Leu/Phe/Val dehydrogenase dimerization domain-containing protein [Dehalococcoidia bacterium]
MRSEMAMGVLGQMDAMGHETVICHRDVASGLRVFVAIHSTVRGPALGGTRWHPYATEDDALRDVLRLSQAMTAKAAVADLPLGGGKAVVIGDPGAKTPEQLAAYARLIDSLGGRYITTTDVGTTTVEMDTLRGMTRYVVGVSPALGGGGDTSELTGVTVIEGMHAALRVAFGSATLDGRHVVVVGVGKVGARVARHAAAAGARVTVADVREDAARALATEVGADVMSVDDALFAECDVLSPNALGNVLNEKTIPRLRCRVVCGAANNQLGKDPEDAALLAARGIVYAPDYVVNSGGLINASVEWGSVEQTSAEPGGYDAARARGIASRVHDTTLAILEAARDEGCSTAEAAQRLVAERLAASGVR